DAAGTARAEGRYRRAEDLGELDLDDLAAVLDGDAGDRVGLPVDVVFPADDVLVRALPHRLLAPADGLDGVLPILTGERIAVAPHQVVAKREGQREPVRRELELVGEIRLGLAGLVVRARECDIDLLPAKARCRVSGDHR